MRTRWIVALFVLGALLFVVGLGGRRAGPSRAPGSTGGQPAPEAQSTSTSIGPVASSPSTAPVSTISPAELEGHLAGVDELERTQPLSRHLPYDSAHFRVDYRVDEAGALILEIELRAILNRPEQLAAYDADLRAYKAEVLEWLRSVGADPAAYRIEWRPPEAASL